MHVWSEQERVLLYVRVIRRLKTGNLQPLPVQLQTGLVNSLQSSLSHVRKKLFTFSVTDKTGVAFSFCAVGTRKCFIINSLRQRWSKCPLLSLSRPRDRDHIRERIVTICKFLTITKVQICSQAVKVSYFHHFFQILRCIISR